MLRQIDGFIAQVEPRDRGSPHVIPPRAGNGNTSNSS
jgi:hypothetical protein